MGKGPLGEFVGFGAACVVALTLHPRVVQAAVIVQVNFEPYFNADVVTNAHDGSFDQVMDTIEGDWAFATDSGNAFGTSCDGPFLPDDGFFPATVDHPEARLGYSNGDDGFNVWQTFDAAGEITVQVPDLAYDTLYLYATGAYQTFLTVTLNYTTGGPDVTAGVAYPSWFDEAPAGFFNLVDGLDRAVYEAGYFCEDVDDPGIVGRAFAVDPARTLDSFTLTRTDNDQGMLSVFGATAALARTVHNYDLSAHFNADLVANAPSGCGGTPSYDHVHDSFDADGHLPTATIAGCTGGGVGLPDDGKFPGTSEHPPFDLAFSNADSGLNAYRRPPGLGNTTFVVDVTDAPVDQLHFFGGGGGGYTVLGIELFYTDATSQVIGGGLILDGILDDPPGTEPTSYQLVDGMKLHETCGAGCWATTNATDAALFGIPVAANPAKVLDEIEITAYDPTGFPQPQSTLGLLGIAGVESAEDFYLYMDDFETEGFTGWSSKTP
jgi:hypothetical protein